MLHVALLDP